MKHKLKNPISLLHYQPKSIYRQKLRRLIGDLKGPKGQIVLSEEKFDSISYELNFRMSLRDPLLFILGQPYFMLRDFSEPMYFLHSDIKRRWEKNNAYLLSFDVLSSQRDMKARQMCSNDLKIIFLSSENAFFSGH